MAISSFSGNSNLQLEITWTQTSQSVANNTTTGTVKVYLRASAYSWVTWTGTKPLTVTVNGGSSTININPTVSSGQRKEIFSRSYTIGHNPNGEKSFSISATLPLNISPYGTATVSQAIQPKTIPRVSGVTANNVNMGSNMTITINANDTNFTHNLRYSFGSVSGTIATGVKGSYSWFVPMTLAEQLPNATSGRGTLVCETYSGSSKIGESQYSFTLTIPDNIRPSIVMIDVVETQTSVNNLNLGANTFVQIMSLPQVLFRSANGVYGSTITGYRAEVVGKNQSTTNPDGLLGMMNYNGSITIRASVTDSRGRISNTVEKTINVLPYFAPVLSFTATRSGAQNTTLTVTRNAKIAPLTVGDVQKNKMTLTFKTAPLGSATYTTNISNASGTYDTVSTFVNSPANLSGTYSATSSFEVLGILEDSFTRTEFKVAVSTESVTYSYDKYGMGIMKIRERGALDVKGDIYANDEPIQQHQLTDNTGSAFNDFNSDFDAHIISGYYHKSSSAPNNPSSRWGLLHVISGGTQVVQYFAERDGTRTLFLRAKTNGNWTPWVEYAKADHKNLINTGWVGTGVDGVTAKRVGDMVYVNINNISLTKATEKQLGNLPENMRPNFSLMHNVAAWSVNSETVKIQLSSTNGNLVVLGPTVSADRSLSTQFSFAI
ncbi:DUF859 family phage minor structural protein [Streptococcus pluranimalium]